MTNAAFRPIDLETWDRRGIFEEFMELDCSYSLTRELRITEFYNSLKAEELRFYPCFAWAAVTAVNAHREFRMGCSSQGQLGYYDFVNPEYTVLNPKTKNMESLNTAYDPCFRRFYQTMTADLDRFAAGGGGTGTRENSVLLSCLPWYSYTGLSFHMKSNLSFLRPMLAWGQYQKRDGEWLLPFTIQAHHAAADGYHCHLLFETLEDILARPKEHLCL